MTQTTWAVAADVLAITGQNVTDSQVNQANSVIEVLSARVYTIASANTGTRDLEWMKRAVAFQCVWMLGQPDFYSRLEVATIQEGRKAIGMKEMSLFLAPMARKALARVSWLRTRSVHVRSPWQDGMTPISSDPDSAGNDFYQVWSPLGSGW